MIPIQISKTCYIENDTVTSWGYIFGYPSSKGYYFLSTREAGKSVKAIYARQLKDTVDFTWGIGVSGVASRILIAMGGSTGGGMSWGS